MKRSTLHYRIHYRVCLLVLFSWTYTLAYSLNITTHTPPQHQEHHEEEVLADDALHVLRLHNIAHFLKINKQAALYAKKNHNRSALATAYWNYGIYYLERLHYDSAFYYYHKAAQLYQSLNNTYYQGKMLYNMAVISSTIHDYTGAEVLTFKAMNCFLPLHRDKQLYYCHNLLGVIYEELGWYDESIKYYEKALSFLPQLAVKLPFISDTYNNLGVLYLKKKAYLTAQNYFQIALTHIKAPHNPHLYARLQDHLGYSYVLQKNYDKAYPLLQKALQCRIHLNYQPGIINSYYHIALYYHALQQPKIAKLYALQGEQQAKALHRFSDQLLLLNLLIQIDTTHQNRYLRDYISVQDHIARKERTTRNKFAKIRFETDDYIIKNKSLVQQRIWLILCSGSALVVMSLLYLLYRQRQKHNVLHLQHQLQQENEQLYQLTIKAQEKFQLGQLRERQRIARDLHDKIVNSLYSLRLQWGFIKLKGYTKDDMDNHERALLQLQDLEKNIHHIAHNLRQQQASGYTFIQGIKHLMHTKTKHTGIAYTIHYHHEKAFEILNEEVRLHSYLIIKELLHNSIKHSGATHLQLHFKLCRQLFVYSFSDNGTGFSKTRKKGLGLYHIQERIMLLKGHYRMRTKTQKGTQIFIVLPNQTL
ncbi:tetratricopeptide repeat protein [Zhouia sp. PK063]|uniref:ATP-binding protein n=1 Tax=Zhouia sp. PK063 TaxID=3373602 RepID=UPI00378D28BC